jgi:hypothetical protein
MVNVYTIRRTDKERMGKLLIEEHQAELAALADPYPAIVTLAHFLRRDLGAAIADGRCAVTCPHRVFGSSLPPLTVIDVRKSTVNGGFVIITATGSWNSFSPHEQLAVTWHDLTAQWKRLSWPMRYALRYVAGAAPTWQGKPRANTLKALQKRGLLIDDQPTPTTLALHRQHLSEFEHVAN